MALSNGPAEGEGVEAETRQSLEDQPPFEEVPATLSDEEGDSDFEAPPEADLDSPALEAEEEPLDVGGTEVEGDEVKTGEREEEVEYPKGSDPEKIPDIEMTEDTGAALVEHEEEEEFTVEDKMQDLNPPSPKRVKVHHFHDDDSTAEIEGKIKDLQDKLMMLKTLDLDCWKCFISEVVVFGQYFKPSSFATPHLL